MKCLKYKWVIGLLSFLLMFPVNLPAEELPPLPKGPLILTSIRPEQLNPEYWINRLPDPHRVIKTPEQMAKFNTFIENMIPERKDIFKIDTTWSGKSIRDQIELEYKAVKGRKLFGVDDRDIPQSLFEQEIKPLIQTDKIPSRITLKWGTAVRATSVRALPSDVKMLEELGDVEFDQLQFTLIKLWTPIGIYHTSSDGKWYYIQAPYSRGWVKAKDIALFDTRDELKKYVKSKDFVVVLGESIPVFKNADLTEPVLRPTMGTVLPLAASTQSTYTVYMPSRGANGAVVMGKGYISAQSDVATQYPAYTQANAIRQAFKLLGVRYGWGGTYNGRDCSGFTHDVFLSLGVAMPRDSRQQALTGTQLNHFEPFSQEEDKHAALRAATPGLTLIRMPLHIMLYLGEENGLHYIIHSTWAERISQTSDEKNRINQVVVSDMNLNGNSYLGSLFDRSTSINEII